MRPVQKVVEIARHERTTRLVTIGSRAFGTVRNVAAIGAAAASLLTGGFFVTQAGPVQVAPVATPAPLVATPAPLIAQLKGRLAFEASFAQDLGTPPPLLGAARPTAPVSVRPDGVDFGPGAFAPLQIRRMIPSKYVAELDLTAQPGTDGTFDYWIRSQLGASYRVQVDVGNELIRLIHIESAPVGVPSRVTSLVPNVIPAAGLQRGQTLHLGVAVDGTRFRLFVGNDLVADVTDTRISVPASQTTSLSMGAAVNKGQLSVNGLRVYGMNEAVAQVSLLTQLKGKIAYEPNLPQDLGTPPPLPSGAQPTAQVRVRPSGGAIEVLPAGNSAPMGNSASIIFRRNIPSRFVGELDLQFQPGSDGSFIWALRSASSLWIQLVVDPGNELLRFQLLDRNAGVQVTSLVPSAIPLVGLQSGRVLHLAAAVDGTRYRVFLDGELIVDVVEPRVAATDAAQVSLGMGAAVTKGGLALSALRVYSLSDVVTPPPTPR